MQKLPEAPDRNAQRRGTVPTKERISFSFSGYQQSDKTYIFPVSGGKGHASVFKRRVG